MAIPTGLVGRAKEMDIHTYNMLEKHYPPFFVSWVKSIAFRHRRTQWDNIKMILAGVFWILVLVLYTWKVLLPLCNTNRESHEQVLLTLAQIILLGLSLHNIYVQSNRFDSGRPVSVVYQGLAWVIAGE
ncbi:hypothetical protein evm_014235 [Chilo suppressalis]|nr:hypothetical protein evm_014235 [Chilo suppressalis]